MKPINKVVFVENKLCGHYFHQECIDIWYSEKNMCPECNQIVE